MYVYITYMYRYTYIKLSSPKKMSKHRNTVTRRNDHVHVVPKKNTRLDETQIMALIPCEEQQDQGLRKRMESAG